MVTKFRPLIQEGLDYITYDFRVACALNFHPVEDNKMLIFLHTRGKRSKIYPHNSASDFLELKFFPHERWPEDLLIGMTIFSK